MFRIVSAELLYSLAGVVAWLSVLLVVSGWALVESPGLSGVPTVLMFMTLALPLITPVNCFLLLHVERNERRDLLWRMLPVRPRVIAGARLMRAAFVPAFAVAIGGLLTLLAAVNVGAELFERLSGAWVLLFLLLTALAIGTFVTLLYDIGGMAFAQVTSVLLLAAVFILNAFVPAFALFVERLTSIAQTAGGGLMMLGILVVLVVADLLVFARRRN